MADQPHYHRAVILFTATRSVSRQVMDNLLVSICMREEVQNDLHNLGILASSVECEEIDDEPGDPADL